MRDYPIEWSVVEPLLLDLGISLSENQASVEIDAATVDDASLILAMDRFVYRNLLLMFPQSAYKMRLFSELEGNFDDIPDTKGVTDVTLQHAMVQRIYTVIRDNLQLIIALTEYFADYVGVQCYGIEEQQKQGKEELMFTEIDLDRVWKLARELYEHPDASIEMSIRQPGGSFHYSNSKSIGTRKGYHQLGARPNPYMYAFYQSPEFRELCKRFGVEAEDAEGYI